MRCKQLIRAAITALLLLASPALHASDPAANIRADASQPYIVQPGDTLWDIANHFFKDPRQWLNIWEHNLYITNPDLIYPGNKIWFDGRRMHQGGLTTVRPQPKIIIRPVERLEQNTDSALLLTALQRQGLIRPDQLQGVGHIIDSRDERLNYGVHDTVYLKLDQPAAKGALFDIFRSTDTLRDPHSGAALGILTKHMGQLRIESAAGGIYRGVITKAFEEIARGDRLMPARSIDPHLVPSRPEQQLSGSVIYMRSGNYEAARHQVIGISLGLRDGLKTGDELAIYKTGRVVRDVVSGEPVTLPQEQIGELLVLVAQQQAAIALITRSRAPIDLGDTVGNLPAQ